MSKETHEWQRERDRRTYLKMLEGGDGVEHDGRRAVRFGVLGVVLLVIGALLLLGLANYALKGKAYDFINSAQHSKVLPRETTKQPPNAASSTSATTENLQKTQVGACATNDFANVQDVKIFREYSDDFAKNIASAREKISAQQMSKNDKIALYNALVLQSKGAIDFYNEKLVKCFTNIAMADEVQSRAKQMNASLRDFHALIQ